MTTLTAAMFLVGCQTAFSGASAGGGGEEIFLHDLTSPTSSSTFSSSLSTSVTPAPLPPQVAHFEERCLASHQKFIARMAQSLVEPSCVANDATATATQLAEAAFKAGFEAFDAEAVAAAFGEADGGRVAQPHGLRKQEKGTPDKPLPLPSPSEWAPEEMAAFVKALAAKSLMELLLSQLDGQGCVSREKAEETFNTGTICHMVVFDRYQDAYRAAFIAACIRVVGEHNCAVESVKSYKNFYALSERRLKQAVANMHKKRLENNKVPPPKAPKKPPLKPNPRPHPSNDEDAEATLLPNP